MLDDQGLVALGRDLFHRLDHRRTGREHLRRRVLVMLHVDDPDPGSARVVEQFAKTSEHRLPVRNPELALGREVLALYVDHQQRRALHTSEPTVASGDGQGVCRGAGRRGAFRGPRARRASSRSRKPSPNARRSTARRPTTPTSTSSAGSATSTPTTSSRGARRGGSRSYAGVLDRHPSGSTLAPVIGPAPRRSSDAGRRDLQGADSSEEKDKRSLQLFAEWTPPFEFTHHLARADGGGIAIFEADSAATVVEGIAPWLPFSIRSFALPSFNATA